MLDFMTQNKIAIYFAKNNVKVHSHSQPAKINDQRRETNEKEKKNSNFHHTCSVHVNDAIDKYMPKPFEAHALTQLSASMCSIHV